MKARGHLKSIPEPAGGRVVEQWLVTFCNGTRTVLYVMEERGAYRCDGYVIENGERGTWAAGSTHYETIDEARDDGMQSLAFSFSDVETVERVHYRGTA